MNATYVIRFARGSGSRPQLAGHFLSWRDGYFVPCTARERARRYDAPHIARSVAIRAESAYPGARFDVIAAQAFPLSIQA